MLLCANCGLDPADEDSKWCIACEMYVEAPLDNDELVRLRVFLLRPRRTAFRMLVFGSRFADRVIREAAGEADWWTAAREWLWFHTPAGRKFLRDNPNREVS